MRRDWHFENPYDSSQDSCCPSVGTSGARSRLRPDLRRAHPVGNSRFCAIHHVHVYSRRFEKFDWKARLNVRNIGVGNELIPVASQPDGSIASWRIRESQSWSLRNTLTL